MLPTSKSYVFILFLVHFLCFLSSLLFCLRSTYTTPIVLTVLGLPSKSPEALYFNSFLLLGTSHKACSSELTFCLLSSQEGSSPCCILVPPLLWSLVFFNFLFLYYSHPTTTKWALSPIYALYFFIIKWFSVIWEIEHNTQHDTNFPLFLTCKMFPLTVIMLNHFCSGHV